MGLPGVAVLVGLDSVMQGSGVRDQGVGGAELVAGP